MLIQKVDSALKPAATNVLDLINQALHSSRELTAELSPPVLQSGDLTSALKWLARWMHKNQDFEVKLQSKERISLDLRDFNVLLFQSVRELLFNALKHSGVKSATVTIERKNEALQITVSDRGSGFDPESIWQNADFEEKFGLIGIRERLVHLGGSFNLNSAPNAGSTITMIVPLEAVCGFKEKGRIF
jgi:signal transduction histidine kinase